MYVFVKEQGNCWYTAEIPNSTTLLGTLRDAGEFLLPIDSLDPRTIYGEIRADGTGRFTFHATGSFNNTIVNGVRVSKGESADISEGSVIRLSAGMANEACIVIIPADLEDLCVMSLPSPDSLRTATLITVDGRVVLNTDRILSSLQQGECLYVDGSLFFIYSGRWYSYNRRQSSCFADKGGSKRKETAMISSRSKQDTSIIVSNVTKEYKGLSILGPLNIHLAPRELIALCGKSGQGKSTFMKLVVGVSRPSEGRIRVIGGTAYVPQDDPMHQDVTVLEHLRYYARIKGIPRDEREQRIFALLSSLDMLNKKDSKIGSELSGGERKRVSLALELLDDPEVLCLDEPTSGLDINTERSLLEYLKGRAHSSKGKGSTILVVTHGFTNIDIYDKVIFFGGGGICYYGPPQQRYEFFGVDSDVGIYEALESNPRRFVKKWQDEQDL